jgi:hypothetical protein
MEPQHYINEYIQYSVQDHPRVVRYEAGYIDAQGNKYTGESRIRTLAEALLRVRLKENGISTSELPPAEVELRFLS